MDKNHDELLEDIREDTSLNSIPEKGKTLQKFKISTVIFLFLNIKL